MARRRHKTAFSVAVTFVIGSLGMAYPAGRCEAAETAQARSSAESERRQLLETTYLGHAAELPGPEEPVVVLKEYLRLRDHDEAARGDSSADTLARWQALAARYPASRYAFAGLGRVYRGMATATDGADTRLAADAYIRAAEIGLAEGRALYTREIAEILTALGDRARLKAVFGRLLAGARDPDERYLARVDFADGLAAFGDDAAWAQFEEAIAGHPENDVEAYNRYARRLLDGGDPARALALVERLPEQARLRRVVPARLRLEALKQLGLDTAPAESEIQRINERFGRNAVGIAPEQTTQEFAHSNAADDCRSAPNAGNTWCDGGGWCLYNFSYNLAEIIYNEARGESIGVQDLVGWTVRNRALQPSGCDVYVGGVNYSACRSTVPCTDPYYCDLSRWYCCVEHGGTTTPGASHSQFNDAHQSTTNLVNTGTYYEALYAINAWVPDVSTGYGPPGTYGCSFSCAGPWCSGGNAYNASPNGPMEYLGYNYCAQRQECKTYKGNVCGGNPPAASCSSGGVNDNYFWNRAW